MFDNTYYYLKYIRLNMMNKKKHLCKKRILLDILHMLFQINNIHYNMLYMMMLFHPHNANTLLGNILDHLLYINNMLNHYKLGYLLSRLSHQESLHILIGMMMLRMMMTMLHRHLMLSPMDMQP